jgi:hypothetical protein
MLQRLWKVMAVTELIGLGSIGVWRICMQALLQKRDLRNLRLLLTLVIGKRLTAMCYLDTHHHDLAR